MSLVEHEPTTDEVLQDEQTDYPTIPVRVEGPVRVQQLPATIGVMASRTLGTSAERLLKHEPRRRRAVLVAKTNPIVVATGQNECDSNAGVEWPVNVPLELTHAEAVWVKSTTATALVSYVHELWTE